MEIDVESSTGCCFKAQSAIFISAGILIVGWFVQLSMSVYRFILAIQWSHANPELTEEGGTKLGVSGLLVVADLSEMALSMLLLAAVFMRDLNKLQPWFILNALVLTAYVPLSIASCIVQVTSPPEFLMAWALIILLIFTVWSAKRFKKEFAMVSLERLL